MRRVLIGAHTLIETNFNRPTVKAYLPAGSFPLIMTSPPYDLEKSYEGRADDGAYRAFTTRWLTRAFMLAAPNGRLCLNVPLDTSFGGEDRPVYSTALQAALAVGWRYKKTIIWNEGNINRRTAWGSWRSASGPNVIAPVETIIVLYKGEWIRGTNGHGQHIPAKDFQDWTNGLWTFPGESAKRIGHPAPFPVELPRRCITLFSFPGEKVLDPFSGSGTTLIAAQRTGRVGVGVDRAYFDLARARLETELNGEKP